MMDWSAWAIIGTGASGMLAAFVGGAVKMTWWLGAKLDDITTKQAIALAEHKREQDQRHVENITRLIRLETALLKNGYSRRRR